MKNIYSGAIGLNLKLSHFESTADLLLVLLDGTTGTYLRSFLCTMSGLLNLF